MGLTSSLSRRIGAIAVACFLLIEPSGGQATAFVCGAKNPQLGLRRPAPPSAPKSGTTDLASAGDLRCKWGRTELKVGFYGGDGSTRAKILKVAKTWEQ